MPSSGCASIIATCLHVMHLSKSQLVGNAVPLHASGRTIDDKARYLTDKFSTPRCSLSRRGATNVEVKRSQPGKFQVVRRVHGQS